jgi:hypothetical protein
MWIISIGIVIRTINGKIFYIVSATGIKKHPPTFRSFSTNLMPL